MEQNRLIIIGAGELGEQLFDLASNSTIVFKIIGYVDDTKPLGTKIFDTTVVGKLDQIENLYELGLFDKIVIAIGYNHMKMREALLNRFHNKIPFATLIHKTCIINSKTQIMEGSIIYPGCIIDKNVKIGMNVLLNLGVIIAHDSIIGNNSYLAPGVVVSGFVSIGKNCFIGTNTTIIDNLKIGDDVIIGAGSVLINNIEEKFKMAGNPAKKI